MTTSRIMALAAALLGLLPALALRAAGDAPQSALSPPVARIAQCDGVSFADDPDLLYVPVREAAAQLRWPVTTTGRITLLGKPVAAAHLRRLPEGTRLLPVRDLLDFGAGIDRNMETGTIRVDAGGRTFAVRHGKKRVEIRLGSQTLLAWQGERLVLKTPCSTGRAGYPTPTGEFFAADRQPMVISQKYGNAEMPWSVQVVGDIYVHGSKSVPPRAASHGCIRLPLTGGNPARWFYDWADVGTEIDIRDR